MEAEENKLLKKAVYSFNKNDYKDALSKYKSYLDSSKDVCAHKLISQCYCNLFNFEKAIKHQKKYLDGIEKDDDDSCDYLELQKAYQDLGRTYYIQANSFIDHDRENKIRKLKSLITPRIKRVLDEANNAFSKSQDIYDKKLKNDEEITDLKEIKAALLLNRGLTIKKKGNVTAGLELINKSLNLCRSHQLSKELHWKCYLALLTHHETKQEYKKAIEIVNKAKKVLRGNENLTYDAQFEELELLLKSGKFEESRNLGLLLCKKADKKAKGKKNVIKNPRQHIVMNYTSTAWLIITEKKELKELLREANISYDSDKDSDEDSESDSDDDCGNVPLNTHSKLIEKYETLGDLTTEVECFKIALEFYKKMLYHAKKIGDNAKISEALVSVYETHWSESNFLKVIPYVKRELKYCKSNNDSVKSYITLLAALATDKNAYHEDINKTLSDIKRCIRNLDDLQLQMKVIDELKELCETYSIKFNVERFREEITENLNSTRKQRSVDAQINYEDKVSKRRKLC